MACFLAPAGNRFTRYLSRCCGRGCPRLLLRLIRAAASGVPAWHSQDHPATGAWGNVRAFPSSPVPRHDSRSEPGLLLPAKDALPVTAGAATKADGPGTLPVFAPPRTSVAMAQPAPADHRDIQSPHCCHRQATSAGATADPGAAADPSRERTLEWTPGPAAALPAASACLRARATASPRGCPPDIHQPPVASLRPVRAWRHVRDAPATGGKHHSREDNPGHACVQPGATASWLLLPSAPAFP